MDDVKSNDFSQRPLYIYYGPNAIYTTNTRVFELATVGHLSLLNGLKINQPLANTAQAAFHVKGGATRDVLIEDNASTDSWALNAESSQLKITSASTPGGTYTTRLTVINDGRVGFNGGTLIDAVIDVDGDDITLSNVADANIKAAAAIAYSKLNLTGSVVVADLANGTDGELITWDAVGAPATVPVGTATHVLTSNGIGAAPTFQANPAGFADPMTTRGDVIIRDATNTTARLGVGAAGEVLGSDGTDISWGSAGAGTWTDTSVNTGTNKTLNDFTNTIGADDIHIEVYNNTGTGFAKGDAVYISGWNIPNSLPEVTIADASSGVGNDAIGLCNEAIANGASGAAILSGELTGIDTTLVTTDGDSVWLSNVGTTTNTLTATKPTGTDTIQKLGVVSRMHVTLGSLRIIGAGRSNDIPNIASANFWLGNGSGVPTAVTMSGDATVTNAGVVTVSIASTDLTDTGNIALLNNVQTFTGVKTFADQTFKINNSADTFAYIINGSAITADRILSLPVITGSDTFATTGLAQTLFNKTLTTGTIFSAAPTINSGIKFTFNASGTTAGLNINDQVPSTTTGGDIWRTTDAITYRNEADTADIVLVGRDTTDTLTNKTIDQDGTGNSITNIDVPSIKTGSNILIVDIPFIVDGGGAEITTGIKGDIVIDFDCTINSVTMLADQSGSVVVDIWKDTYANYPPTNADSITASAVPTITTALKSQDATLTGWTTSITAGDTLRFNVDSVTTIQRVTVSLKVTKVV